MFLGRPLPVYDLNEIDRLARTLCDLKKMYEIDRASYEFNKAIIDRFVYSDNDEVSTPDHEFDKTGLYRAANIFGCHCTRTELEPGLYDVDVNEIKRLDRSVYGGDEHEIKRLDRSLYGGNEHKIKRLDRSVYSGDEHKIKRLDRSVYGGNEHEIKRLERSVYGGDELEIKRLERSVYGGDEHEVSRLDRAVYGGDEYEIKRLDRSVYGADELEIKRPCYECNDTQMKEQLLDVKEREANTSGFDYDNTGLDNADDNEINRSCYEFNTTEVDRSLYDADSSEINGSYYDSDGVELDSSVDGTNNNEGTNRLVYDLSGLKEDGSVYDKVDKSLCDYNLSERDGQDEGYNTVNGMERYVSVIINE